MNYKDLKIIWDGQNERPVFTIDEDALLASIEDKCSSIEKWLKWNEHFLIPLALFAGVPLALQILISREPSWPEFGVGVIFILEAIFTWILLKKRKEQERAYEQAIIPSIEKAIYQNKHLATLLKRLLILFHIPAAVIGLVGLIFFGEETMPWMWVLFIGMVAYSIWETPRYLRNKLYKEREELAAIRSRLLEMEQ